jgi:hypothetical protein
MEDIIADMHTPEGEQKLAPLADALKECGSSTPAAEVMLLAQKDDRTKGKSPDELAEMIGADKALVKDLEALKPGGELDRAYKEFGVGGEDSKTVPKDEEEETDEEGSMASFLGGSASMKDGDVKKAVAVKKEMGGKSPRKMNFDQKADFMGKMG